LKELDKTYWDLVAGVIIIIINLYWTWFYLHLWYLYHYTDILFLHMFPDWVLYLNSSFGFVGILIGTRLIRKKMKIKSAILTDFLILMIGGVLNII